MSEPAHDAVAVDPTRFAARLQQLTPQVVLANAAQPVNADAACSLAGGALALLRDVFIWEVSLEAEVEAPELCCAVNATVSLLEAVMLSMPKRYNPRAPAVAQEAQLALLHTCCDLLRACGAAAPWISMDEQDRLLVTTAGLHCAVAYTPGLAAAAQAAASTGSHAAAAAFTNTLCSLLQLCTASITAAQDLLVEAEVTHLDDLAKLAAPGVAAELPRSRKLAACLAAAVELAQALGRNAATANVQRSLLPAVITTLHTLMRTPAWRPQADAVVADEQRAVGIVALTVAYLRTLAVGLQLPPERRPDGCTWPAAAWAASLIGCTLLVPACDKWFAAADGASLAAAVVAAAQLVQHVQLDELPDPAREPHAAFFLATLPGRMCGPLCEHDATRARLGSEQRWRVAAQLAPAVSCLPQLLRVAVERASTRPEARLPNISSLAGSAQFTFVLLGKFWGDVFTSGSSSLQSLARSAGDCAAWAGAACAALRCLAQLGSTAQQQALREQEAAVLASFVNAADGLAARAAVLTHHPLWRGDAGMAQAAWELHTTLCRRLHLAAAGSSAALQLDAEALLELLNAMGNCVFAAEGPPVARDPGPEATRRVRAVCTAHWEAITACFARLPPGVVAGIQDRATSLLSSLACLIGRAPLAVATDPELHSLFANIWRQLPQAPEQRSGEIEFALATSQRSPCLAAVLVADGQLSEMLSGGDVDDSRTRSAAGVLSRLRDAAQPLVESPAADGSAEDAALQQQLRQGLTALAVLPMTHGRILQVLPSARPLAAALLAWWRRPRAQQERQLEAAQATAARSCAYLHCANLGGEGGPAAGQGEGSQRCSACRVVWYCGTACSHADWRAGHRRVCKALGAARAAEKERRRQEQQDQA